MSVRVNLYTAGGEQMVRVDKEQMMRVGVVKLTHHFACPHSEFRAACCRDLGLLDLEDEAAVAEIADVAAFVRRWRADAEADSGEDGSHAVVGMIDPQNAANRLYGRAGEALAAASKRLR